MQETQVLSLGWEDPLEKGMTMQSSFLARRIPWTEEPGGQSMGSQTAGHDWATDTNPVHQAPQQSHQLSSVTQSGLTATPWSAARLASLSVTNSRSLLKLMPIELVMPSSHLILCRPLLLPPSIFPSIRDFSSESVLCIRWPNQSFRVSASVSVLSMYIRDLFPLGWTGWISLQSKGLSRAFSNTTVQKHQFFSTQLSLWSNSHIHTWPPERPDGPLLAKP